MKTDLFALGSAIYFIMMGHEVFLDLDSDKDDEEIKRRFRGGQFPVDPPSVQLRANAGRKSTALLRRLLAISQLFRINIALRYPLIT